MSLPSPLSSIQQAIWVDDRLDPKTIRNNISTAVRVYSQGDEDTMRSSLQYVIDANPSLRTTFTSSDGKPSQSVRPAMDLDIDVVDASRWSEDAVAARLSDYHCLRFDLENGPPIRFRVLARADDEYIIFITVHHLVSDLWSNTLIGHQIAAAYGQAIIGSELPEIDQRVSYIDFVTEERRYIDGPKGSRALDFWRPLFDSWVPQVPPVAQRRVDDSPIQQSGVSALVETSLPPELAARIDRFARDREIAPRSVVLAAFQALLHRTSGSDDIFVADVKANRSARLGRVVGCCINHVPRRAVFDSSTTLGSLVAAEHIAARRSRGHERLPFPYLLQTLRPGHGATPFFAAAFAWQKTSRAVDPQMTAAMTVGRSGDASDLGGFRIEPYAMPIRSSPWPLTLIAVSTGEDLHLAFEYQTHIFDERTVQRLLIRLEKILFETVAHPGTRPDDVDLLTVEERLERAKEWTAAEQGYDESIGTHTVFERQVAETPQACAVRHGSKEVSYETLNALADQLAGRVVASGIRPGDLVGLCLDRSVEMIIAMLAVWKAGAGYVPMDPDFPTERLRSMVADAHLDLVVTRSSVWTRLDLSRSAPELNIIDVDDPPGESAASTPPAAATNSDQVAYVIFTSGSTGRPKGVVVEHRNVVNFLTSMARRPGLTSSDVMLAATTLSFDISLLELILPLTVGATVKLIGRDEVIDPTVLGARLDDVTVAQGTPTMWKLLIGSGWPGRDDLTILCGGEPLSRSLANDLAPRCRALWNLYGPTETTVWSSVHRVDAGSGAVSIGAPIDNTRLHVVDDLGRLAPDGIPGELWIGGAGVARGYIGREDLTLDRFLDDPFVESHDGAVSSADRLYRTGDVVIRHADGHIEFLGRLDDQIKLRGHRIELGEIETVIARQPGISGAVADVREFRVDDQRLVVYYTVDSKGPVVDTALLRVAAGDALPTYMTPSMFIEVDAFPRTPNNKLDRGRLPPPVPTSVPPDPDDVDATTLLAVLKIYREVFDREVGTFDDFFDLGGHSMIATRIASRIHARLGRNVGLRNIFDYPTPASLAAVVEAAPEMTVDSTSGAGSSVESTDYALSFSQERMWFLHQLHPSDTAYHLVAAVRIRGPLDRDAVQWAANRLVQRHTALRSQFVDHGAGPRLVVNPSFEVVFDEVDLTESSDLATDQQRLDAARDEVRKLSARPFDLSTGPLFRCSLSRLAPDDTLVSLVIHHVVADNWAFGVLGSEALILYDMYGRGGEHARSHPGGELLRSQSRAELHGEFQRRLLDERIVDEQLAYWKEQLHDLRPLELPTDRPRSAASSSPGASVIEKLPHHIVERIGDVARQYQASPFMVMLAAFDVFVARLTGAVDIPVGVPIANRHHLASEPLLTTLVNTLVLRVDLTEATRFSDVIRRVRDVTLEAYTHQDLPFEQLVNELAPARDLTRSPLFQVLFNVHNAPFELAPMNGLDFEEVPIERNAAQFDLSFTFAPMSDEILILEYATDLYDVGTARELLDTYVSVLEEMTTQDAAVGPFTGASRPTAATAVPEPLDADRVLSKVDDTPREGLERQLATLWEDALGVTEVGRHDDFFELGGQSLLAVRLFAGIHRLTGRRPPLITLFGAPTVAQLADVLESGNWLSEWTSLIEIERRGTQRPFFYVSPFLISALSLHDLATDVAVDRPFYALQPQGLEASDPVHDRVEDMAAHYITEMKTVQPEGPYLIGGHCAGGWVAFEMYRQLQAAGDLVDTLIIVDVEPPGIDPPKIKIGQYLLSRLVLYGAGGRLFHAIRWQLGRSFGLWSARSTVDGFVQRQADAVRQGHDDAYRRYRGGHVDGDLTFIQSEEWSKLPDKAWHLRWDELISGDVTVIVIPGAHARLLDGDGVLELGSLVKAALDRS